MNKSLITIILLSTALIKSGNVDLDMEYYKSKNIIHRCLDSYDARPEEAIDALVREFKIFYDRMDRDQYAEMKREMYISILLCKLQENPILARLADRIINRIKAPGITPAAHAAADERSCPACLVSSRDFPANEKYVTKCCNQFICIGCARGAEQAARELYRNLQDPVWRRDYAAQPDFTGWPTESLEHAKCPNCRHYPLEVEPDRIKPAARVIECDICSDEKPEREFHELMCGHYFCKDCLRRMIDDAMYDVKTKSLKCPADRCSRPLDIEDIRAIYDGNRSKIEAYNDAAFHELVAVTPGMKHCPTPDCPNSFELEVFPGGEDLHVPINCQSCRKDYCGNCLQNHFYDGRYYETCAKLAAARKRAEVSDASGGRFRPCPRCEVMCERTAGCKYMTCGRCNAHYCWYCNIICINAPQYHDFHECAAKPCPSCHVTVKHTGVFGSNYCSNCHVRFCWDCDLILKPNDFSTECLNHIR